ncbi:MAG TPA: DUF1080 domain-containing protein [Bacteroidales bacterium]|nr:DUF1080 domain-containing protein [Bacteroidales bacterium]
MACRVVVLTALILLSACRENKTTPAADNKTISFSDDSTLIFNGSSLDSWEITNFGPQGPVSVSGDELILGMGEGCTGVTYKGSVPLNNYEISLEARRREGNDFFCGITFPVQTEFCTFIAGGWGGATVGLSCIDGKDAAENETTTLRNFERNRWYGIRIRVTDNMIEAWIDNEKVVALSSKGKKLSVRAEVTLSKPLGLASWNTVAGIRNVRLKEI